MKILFIKTGAAGDVLRTTSLLHVYKNYEIDWFVDEMNINLLPREYIKNIFTKFEHLLPITYDLVISLEEDRELLINIFNKINYIEIFGAFINFRGELQYTDSSQEWFNMGISSVYGINEANKLKLSNRCSYQEIIFRGLGFNFNSEEYILPKTIPKSTLKGDIAIASKAGNRWLSKNWYYCEDLMKLLSKDYIVNILPTRNTIIEHLADIRNHELILSGDSLPMHVALGMKKKCIALFFCTSPWEIYDYGRLKKIVSPLLYDNFYIKKYCESLTKSILVDDVMSEIKKAFI